MARVQSNFSVLSAVMVFLHKGGKSFTTEGTEVTEKRAENCRGVDFARGPEYGREQKRTETAMKGNP